MTFKAAVLEAHEAPLVLHDLYIPATLEPGQVLVRVMASGICGAQLGEIAGVKGLDRHMPHLLGHEGAGVVLKCGPGVTHIAVDDHVVMHWRKGDGIEAAPAMYISRDGQPIGAGRVTTFNELAVVSENRLTPISKTVPFDVAALMGCAVTTGIGLITNEARLKIGQSIAVFGCGGVGLNVIQGAALAGAYPIVGIDIVPEKLERARQFGATDVFNEPWTLFSILARGADICVDTTGIPGVIEQAFQLTAPGGCLYLVGQVRHDRTIQIQTLPMHTGKRLVASDGGGTNPSVDIPRYLALYEAGKLKLHSLITHHCELAEINSLLDEVRCGTVGRGMILMCSAY